MIAIANKNVLLFLTLFLLLPSPSYSQNEKQIVLNYKNALQKTADLSAVQSIELKGDFVIQKLLFPMHIYVKAPGLLRLEMKFQTLTFLQISNDSLKWEYNPLEDKNLITPLEKKSEGWQSADNSTFDFVNYDLLRYEELKYKVKLLRRDKLDSVNVYVLELIKDKHKGPGIKFYVNTQTSLLYKVEDERGYRIFGHYTNLDGFVFPKFTIDSNPKQQIEVHFSEITINNTFPDSLFIIPQSAFEKNNKAKSSEENLIVKADRFYNSNQFDSATALYSKVINLNSKNYRALNSRGLAKIGNEDYYDAISDFNRAIEIDASGSKAYNNRGLAKYYLGDQKGAIKDYSKALELEPTFFIALKNRATAHFENGNFEQAANDFSEAVKLVPDNGEVQYSYGVAVAQLQQHEEALKAYDLASKNGFTTAGFYNHKGVSEYTLEKFESARESFEQAIKLDTDNLQYLENYGRTLYALNDFKAASEQFEKYLKRQSDKAEVHNLLGLCKYHEENYKGAIKDFSKAIELNTSEATYYDNRAASKELLEDYVGAINDYSESIRVYPNDASVFYKRGMIKLYTSKKIEGCLDLATANEMKYEPAKEAILKNCN